MGTHWAWDILDGRIRYIFVCIYTLHKTTVIYPMYMYEAKLIMRSEPHRTKVPKMELRQTVKTLRSIGVSLNAGSSPHTRPTCLTLLPQPTPVQPRRRTVSAQRQPSATAPAPQPRTYTIAPSSYHRATTKQSYPAPTRRMPVSKRPIDLASSGIYRSASRRH